MNGLPASAFDALKLLPFNAETLIQLLLSARDAGERGMIWGLQNELPFLWLALPLRAWRSAMESELHALASALESALGKEKAMIETVAWMRGVCGDTYCAGARGRNYLRHGRTAGRTGDHSPSLQDLTISYIRNQHQRGGDAPNDLAKDLLQSG